MSLLLTVANDFAKNLILKDLSEERSDLSNEPAFKSDVNLVWIDVNIKVL
jgi:hypothetical protein